MIAFKFNILQDHQKPLFGEPCNNCGLCCRVQACHLSREFLHSEQAPCIALEVHDGKFLCGMILRPSHYLGLNPKVDEHLGKLHGMLVDAGAGCTMDDVVMAVQLTQREQPANSDSESHSKGELLTP